MPFVCYATMQQHNHHKKFSKNKGKNRKTFQNPIHCCQTNTHFSGREGNTVALFVTKRKNWVMLWVWILIPEIVTWLACVASISARVRQEHWDESNKKKEWQGRGRGRGEKETLARKPHDFEKLCSPTNSAFDWLGAGSVDYFSTRNINQNRYVLLTCVADLVWCYLWSQITNALVWYLFESCLCEGLSDLSLFNQKYNWRSSSGD